MHAKISKFELFVIRVVGLLRCLCGVAGVAVIVWKPRDSIIYPMKRWKPRYRSLGVPPPVPSYIRYDIDHWPDKLSYVNFKLCYIGTLLKQCVVWMGPP